MLSGHPGPTQALSLAVPEAAANSLFRNILPVSPSASIFCLQRGTFPSTNLNKIMDFPYIDENITPAYAALLPSSFSARTGLLILFY